MDVPRPFSALRVPALLALLAMSSNVPAEPEKQETAGVRESTVHTFHKNFRRLNPAPLRNPEMETDLCRPLYAKNEASHGPHAVEALSYYANPAAAAALDRKAKTFPPGSVIVKEKLARAGPSEFRVAGVGGMIKRAPGLDPDNGDWEYYYSDSETPFVSGKITSCASCHAKARAEDFVFEVRALAGAPESGRER